MRRRRAQTGFTLIEMVAVITVSAILAIVVWRNISQPIEGFEDTTRRARLVDIADTALSRMTREIRLALSNSVRVDASGTAIEFLRTLDGGRYRAEAAADGSGDPLSFTAVTDSFDVLGSLPARTVNFCGTNACRLVIYNVGPPGGPDAYAGQNIAPITALTATSVTFAGAQPFPLRSPRQRFQIVDTPVSFVCNTGAGDLRRYDGYAITPGQIVPPGGTSQLLADHLTACGFTYVPGTATRAGLVTVSITVTDQSVSGGAPERVSLLQQAHVPNAP